MKKLVRDYWLAELNPHWATGPYRYVAANGITHARDYAGVEHGSKAEAVKATKAWRDNFGHARARVTFVHVRRYRRVA